MRRALLIAAVLAAHGAYAADVEVQIENFERTSTGAAEVVVKFENRTNRAVQFAAASCGLLDQAGRALTTVDIIAQNISPGSRAFGKSFGPNDARVAKAECRLRDFDYAP
jgi:hypothetical protein